MYSFNPSFMAFANPLGNKMTSIRISGYSCSYKPINIEIHKTLVHLKLCSLYIS